MNTLAEEIPVGNLHQKVIHFPEGLPGFPTSRKFVMEQKPEERPFAWMRSVTDPNLAFAVVDAYAWVSDFTMEVDDDVLLELGSLDPMDYAVYFILRIERGASRTTLQAKPNAPVLVNIRTRQARQAVVALGASLEKAEALCLAL